jgi:NAD(P)-dependent dehydrogenase (short-subunit alcohol dehydrogenase family)
MKLQGKVALVTGAGRGIGKVIAQHLAEEGAATVLNYAHTEQGARDTAESIRKAGGQAFALKADVAHVDEIRTMVQRAIEEFGKLDILVNNSGIDPTPTVPFFDVTEDLFDAVIDTNLKGTYFCSQFAAREMRRLGKGRIINIGSVHSQATMPQYSVYAASKGGINALTRQLALDLAAFNITVNVIAPGAVEVEKFIGPAYDRAATAKEIPLGRIGIPRDVSGCVVFLASDDADWLTGQVVTVDGGSTTRLYLYAGRPIPYVEPAA